MNPVNTDTYASLIKSMSAEDSELEFEKDDASPVPSVVSEDNTANQPLFSTNQVMAILEKALSVGAGASEAPNLRTGGDALQVSNMRHEDEVEGDANLNPGGDARIKSQTAQGDERVRTEKELIMAEREKKKLENSIEKSTGEGSKGGKVIGHTSTGKPIYETAAHSAHAGFNSREHTEAAHHHLVAKIKVHETPRPKDPIQQAARTEKIRHHFKQAQTHLNHLPDLKDLAEKTHKSLKPLSFDLYKSSMVDLLDKLQKLYPEHSRSEIWAAVQDRIERKFPDIKDV